MARAVPKAVVPAPIPVKTKQRPAPKPAKPEPKKRRVFELRIPGVRLNKITGRITKASNDLVADYDYIVRIVYNKEDSPFVKVEGQTYDNRARRLCPDCVKLPYALVKKVYEEMGQFLADAEEYLTKRKVKPQKWKG